ncbi:MAG: SCO family protein, partial [Leeuwenhoekiella sp.]
ICIPMSKNLVSIQKEFKDNNKFGIASISIDPENDTPQVLKAYADEYGASAYPNWNFLTGSRDTIYNLANEKFGLLAGENPNLEGGLLHSGYFALIDQNGFIRSRIDEFGNPKIYYKGSVPRDAPLTEDGDNTEIDILVDDIKLLLKQN